MEHRQKSFVTFSGFWSLEGVGDLGESIKKRKILGENLFSDESVE